MRFDAERSNQGESEVGAERSFKTGAEEGISMLL
jgi:hypothetical protein